MGLIIRRNTQWQQWQLEGNYNIWDFPLLQALDERLLPFSSEETPAPPNMTSVVFVLRRLDITGGIKTILNTYEIDSSELKRKILPSGDYYYFYADKAINDIVDDFSSPDDLLPGLYEYGFLVNTQAGLTSESTYTSDIFCYGASPASGIVVPIPSPVGEEDSGHFDKAMFDNSFNK